MGKRRSVMCVVTCEICFYWETADLRDDTEKKQITLLDHLDMQSNLQSVIVAIHRLVGVYSDCICLLNAKKKCFCMHNSLRVQQKLPTVTASLMILYQSIKTCMGGGLKSVLLRIYCPAEFSKNSYSEVWNVLIRKLVIFTFQSVSYQSIILFKNIYLSVCMCTVALYNKVH